MPDEWTRCCLAQDFDGMARKYAQNAAATGATQGIMVDQVGPGTPAEAAGIRAGDVMISFARLALVNTQHLLQLIAGRQPGDVVEIVLLRAGKPLTLQVKLGARQ